MDLLNNLRMNTLNTSLIFSMIKYERSNHQAPSNSLLPLEECVDELLVLLRVNLVVLEQLVKGLAVLSGQCLGLLLGLGLHLLQ